MAWDMQQIDTPALLIDLDVVEANLGRIATQAYAAGFGLWPHTKTHKSTWLAERQLAHGAEGLTVAKLGEAEVMRAAGLTNLLIAYPLVGPIKEHRLAELLRRGTRVRIALDSPEAADAASRAARAANAEVGILLEIDSGFKRVGIPPGQPAVPLAQHIMRLPGLRFLGISSFAGHISNVTEEAERQRILAVESQTLGATREALAQSHIPVEVISIGGTHHEARLDHIHGVTQVRPGTYIYNDRNTLLAGSCAAADCAASLLLTVVSAHPGRAVVDGGSKAFSSDGNPFGGYGQVKGHPNLTFERMSEEHGVLTWEGNSHQLAVGDRIEIIPNHICPVVNLHEMGYGIRAGQVERLIHAQGRGKMQ
jgi:D-serine deaminase-like pyridoxal phosphate-dependent protein